MRTHLPFRRRASLFAIAAAGLALGGCHADRIVAGDYPQTVSQRHPIGLSEGATRLDLPVGAGGSGLTARQKQDVRTFAADWRKNGRGPLGMMVPAGGAGAHAAPEIRATLAAAGVPSTQIVSSRYDGGRGGPALVKLGFVKLKAGLSHPCGLWPEDLGYGGGDVYGQTQNRDYWNYGCASQQNLAAMVADPEDLARPRAEEPVYAARRMDVIDKYRKAQDTSTDYRQEEARVSDVGGEQ